MAVYGYGRHSTDKQGLTEEAQRTKVEAYIRTHLPDQEYAGWVYDSATSGSQPLFERPSGRNLLTLLQPGDHVVWAKLDRAFRSVIDGASTLAMLGARRVFVHSLDLGLDTSTAIGRCICTVMLAFAELERSYASQRTKDALRVKRDAGKPAGAKPPIGWHKVGKKRDSYYAPDMDERKQVQEISELRDAGMSYETIQLELRNVRRPNGRRWNKNSIRLAVMAARLGFPKSHAGRERPGEVSA
jgi:putative DNA-invertase from lambdoid prophage Rac